MTDTNRDRPLIFGEVLFDRFPDGNSVLGGAPFNVAWNLRALGEDPLLISAVGRDKLGDGIRSAMEAWRMDTRGLQTSGDHATGTVTIEFTDGEPSFNIDHPRAYDAIVTAPLPDAGRVGLLYHGSLAARADMSRTTLDELCADTRAPAFVDVNLRDPWWDGATVSRMLAKARWAKLNEHELARLAPTGTTCNEQADAVLAAADLEALIVTLGGDGARVHLHDGQRHVAECKKGVEIVDTVGAGDAFSSVVIFGLLRDWPWPRILQCAQDFAAAVVGLRGATIDDPDFYEPFATEWTSR